MIKSSLKNISDLGICQAKKIGIFRGLMVLERNRTRDTWAESIRGLANLWGQVCGVVSRGLVSVWCLEVSVPILFALAGVERCRVYNVSRKNLSTSIGFGHRSAQKA